MVALRKDGTTFDCEIQARMMNYKGKLIRITALRDISEKVKAQRELNLHKSHLEEEIKKKNKRDAKNNKSDGRKGNKNGRVKECD